MAKNAPWWLARRDYFSAKAPGHVNGWAAPPTLSAHTRWPLGLRDSATNLYIQRTKARVWLTPNTCFFCQPRKSLLTPAKWDHDS